MPFASVLALVVLLAQLTCAGAFSAVPNLGGTLYPAKCSQWRAADIQNVKTCFRDKSNDNHCCTLSPKTVPEGSDWEGGYILPAYIDMGGGHLVLPPYIDIPWDDCDGSRPCGDTRTVRYVQ